MRTRRQTADSMASETSVSGTNPKLPALDAVAEEVDVSTANKTNGRKSTSRGTKAPAKSRKAKTTDDVASEDPAVVSAALQFLRFGGVSKSILNQDEDSMNEDDQEGSHDDIAGLSGVKLDTPSLDDEKAYQLSSSLTTAPDGLLETELKILEDQSYFEFEIVPEAGDPRALMAKLKRGAIMDDKAERELMKKASLKQSLERGFNDGKQKRKPNKDHRQKDSWHRLPKQQVTPEMEKELQILKLRPYLDPKLHVKKDDGLTIPERFHVGTVVDSAHERFSADRIPKRQRGRGFVDQVLQAEELRTKHKRKYREIAEQGRNRSRVAKGKFDVERQKKSQTKRKLKKEAKQYRL
eukprot:Clim_evm3s18 gene=Clim_evmTU3s18